MMVRLTSVELGTAIREYLVARGLIPGTERHSIRIGYASGGIGYYAEADVEPATKPEGPYR